MHPVAGTENLKYEQETTPGVRLLGWLTTKQKADPLHWNCKGICSIEEQIFETVIQKADHVGW